MRPSVAPLSKNLASSGLSGRCMLLKCSPVASPTLETMSLKLAVAALPKSQPSISLLNVGQSSSRQENIHPRSLFRSHLRDILTNFHGVLGTINYAVISGIVCMKVCDSSVDVKMQFVRSYIAIAAWQHRLVSWNGCWHRCGHKFSERTAIRPVLDNYASFAGPPHIIRAESFRHVSVCTMIADNAVGFIINHIKQVDILHPSQFIASRKPEAATPVVSYRARRTTKSFIPVPRQTVSGKEQQK